MKIQKLIDQQVMRKAVLKYKIMRVRIKMSYYAFMQHKTIEELIFGQILASYNQLNGYPVEFIDP